MGSIWRQCVAGPWRWLWLSLMLWCAPSLAGWEAYTSSESGFNSPVSYANQRTIDFTSNSLTTEQTAGRLTYSTSLASGASFTQTLLSSVTGISGNHVNLNSGTSGTASTLTINFPNGGTSYLAFDWYLGLKDQNGAAVKFTFSDGTSQTLYSCNSSSSSTCLGAYVPSFWLTDLFNFLTLCLFGCNQYDTVYLTYTPSSGVKITSVQFISNRCDGCGFLGLVSLDQDMYVDNLVYVDPTVGPHHLEVTTPSTTATAGNAITFTVKACANAACTSTYTTGMSGTLTLAGTGLTAGHPSGQVYTIAPRSATTTVSETISPAGTATVSLSLPSIAPSGSPSVYCGIGVAAASGNSCNLTILQSLHHVEVTTTATTADINTPLVFTVKACADAACSTVYTGGLTGTLTVGGVTASPSSQAFTINAGVSTTTVSVTPTSIGTMTVSLSSLSQTATSSPSVYCGMGVTATALSVCTVATLQSLDHLEVTTPNSTNVSCQPYTYTIKACADAASPCTAYTRGVSGTLTVSGTGLSVSYPTGQTFAIVAGTSSTTLSVWAKTTTTATATAALSGLSATAVGSKPLWCGAPTASSTASCGVTVSSSLLSFSVPNHVADSSQSISLSAVKSSADSSTCTSLFAGLTKTLSFSCSRDVPTTGTQAIKLGGVSLACGGSGISLPLVFNASGVATTTLQYPDVGKLTLSGAYVGAGSDLGLSLSGSSQFVAYPASLVWSAAPSTLTAGASFAMTLTAKTSSGGVAYSFGQETPAISDYIRVAWAKTAPTGSGSVAGSFSGKGTGASGSTTAQSGDFSAGVLSLSDLQWSEVGVGDLTASLVGSSYLGVPLSQIGRAHV